MYNCAFRILITAKTVLDLKTIYIYTFIVHRKNIIVKWWDIRIQTTHS